MNIAKNMCKYKVARKTFDNIEQACAYASHIHRISGIIVAVEEVRKPIKPTLKKRRDPTTD